MTFKRASNRIKYLNRSLADVIVNDTRASTLWLGVAREEGHASLVLECKNHLELLTEEDESRNDTSKIFRKFKAFVLARKMTKIIKRAKPLYYQQRDSIDINDIDELILETAHKYVLTMIHIPKYDPAYIGLKDYITESVIRLTVEKNLRIPSKMNRREYAVFLIDRSRDEDVEIARVLDIENSATYYI